MKHYVALFLLYFASVTASTAASVEIDRFFQGVTKTEEAVAPAQFKLVPIGALKAGDQILVQVETSNKVYNDITACLATESEARAYSPRAQCKGQLKARTPFRLQDQVQADANYYLILDNSYAMLIKKSVSVTIVTKRSLSDDEISKMKAVFQSVQSMMTQTFENSDFQIFVKPCGQSNAFSNNRTADITLCSEFIHDMLMERNVGALISVLLHEYGHSLLNKWGEPGSSEEDMADQFAAVMLLRGGDNGRRLLQEWIGFWLKRDSRAEAQHQIMRGDTHTLSIQRARNIQNAMNFPEELTRRWNKMLYRHMSREALAKVIAKPTKADDPDLANEAARQK